MKKFVSGLLLIIILTLIVSVAFAQKPALYGPYSNIAEAEKAVPVGLRNNYTVGIKVGTEIIEYQWKNGQIVRVTPLGQVYRPNRITTVISGQKGDAGTQGVAGSQGVKGEQGLTGATGSQGIQGIKGDPGQTGQTGAAGNQGTAGSNGATGATGATGNTGPKGDTGATGTAGLKGETGATGATGQTGASGSIGLTGSTGPAGATGATGAKGDKGDAGTIGLTGPVGPSGVTNLQISSAGVTSTGALIGGATQSITVTYDKPFTDNNYKTTWAAVSGFAILSGLSVTIVSPTATGCTVQIKNTGTLALTISTLVLIIHAYKPI